MKEKTVRQPPLGQEEWEILRCVAEHAPATVREVADHVAETKGLARTTVLTVMERLRAKRVLQRRKSGGVYRYAPRIPLGELAQGMVQNFVEGRLQGMITPFLAYLSQSAKVTDEDLKELKDLVKELEQRQGNSP
jgi:predicted transcriptional regulator